MAEGAGTGSPHLGDGGLGAVAAVPPRPAGFRTAHRAFGTCLEAGGLWLRPPVDAAARGGPVPITPRSRSTSPEEFGPPCARVRAVAAVWKENRGEGGGLVPRPRSGRAQVGVARRPAGNAPRASPRASASRPFHRRPAPAQVTRWRRGIERRSGRARLHLDPASPAMRSSAPAWPRTPRTEPRNGRRRGRVIRSEQGTWRPGARVSRAVAASSARVRGQAQYPARACIQAKTAAPEASPRAAVCLILCRVPADRA